MGSMSIMHWAIVAAVVALLFGRNKISGLMEDVAHGIKSFKKGMQNDDGQKPTPSNVANEDGFAGRPTVESDANKEPIA